MRCRVDKEGYPKLDGVDPLCVFSRLCDGMVEMIMELMTIFLLTDCPLGRPGSETEENMYAIAIGLYARPGCRSYIS